MPPCDESPTPRPSLSHQVSILVLVDAALRLNESGKCFIEKLVSILVLVDAALRQNLAVLDPKRVFEFQSLF